MGLAEQPPAVPADTPHVLRNRAVSGPADRAKSWLCKSERRRDVEQGRRNERRGDDDPTLSTVATEIGPPGKRGILNGSSRGEKASSISPPEDRPRKERKWPAVAGERGNAGEHRE
ncbi:hypothetical protein KM043_002630 [Ampulex compressa]|nr:hypothetical protein KM043_002630 [Ampulex compressa]